MTSLTVTPTGTRRPTFDDLASRLAWARESAGITQDSLAAQLGISRRTVSNYESGAQRPKLSRLVLWANVTDVDAVWLAGMDYGKEPITSSVSPNFNRRELSWSPVTGVLAA
jgi:transcriptional regulator with XRE-family HTH domain